MPTPISQGEREPQKSALPGVDLGPVAQQEFDDVHISPGGGQAEGRIVGHVAVLLVSAQTQQYLHYLVAAPGAGQGEGSVFGAFRLSLNVRPVIYQYLHHLRVARGRREDERSEACNRQS